MSDFAFQIIGDATPTNKAIDGVVEGLGDIKKTAATTSKGLDMGFQQAAESIKKADQQTKSLRKSMDDYGAVTGKMPGVFDRFKGAMKAVGNVVTPFNQALEIGGKALRFAEAGLEAYGKTSARAAEEVAALTKEFGEYKKAVMETVGELTVELLKPAMSFDKIRESIIKLESYETWRRLFVKKGEAFGDFFGDDETADPMNALSSAASGLKSTLSGLVDRWNTDGRQFVDSLSQGMRDTAAATKKAAEEAKRLAEERARLMGVRPLEVEFDQINRALTGDGFRDGIKKGADELATVSKELLEMFNRANEERAKKAQEEIDRAAEKAAEAQIALAEKAEEAAARVSEAWGTGLGSVAAEFLNMAAQGETSIERLGEALAKLALQIAAMQIGGPFGAALGAFAGGLNLGGNRYGGDHVITGKPLETFGLPRAQHGADWRIGGPAGPDKTLVAFWGSRDESVHVRTPADRHQARRAMVGSNRDRGVTNVIMQNSPREIVSGLRTNAGETEYVRLNRKFRRN